LLEATVNVREAAEKVNAWLLGAEEGRRPKKVNKARRFLMGFN